MLRYEGESKHLGLARADQRLVPDAFISVFVSARADFNLKQQSQTSPLVNENDIVLSRLQIANASAGSS